MMMEAAKAQEEVLQLLSDVEELQNLREELDGYLKKVRS